MTQAEDLFIERLEEETTALVAWCDRLLTNGEDPAHAMDHIAQRLGATVRHEGERTWVEFGLWSPDLDALGVAPGDVYLELLIDADDALDLAVSQQEVALRRVLIPMQRSGRFLWAAVSGVPVGSRAQLGALYWLRFRDRDGEWRTGADHLARSLPFGAFGPAEVYDVEAMHAQRGDLDWYAKIGAKDEDREAPRIAPPINLLEVHIGTASSGGTVASLTRRLRRIAQRVEAGRPLTPADEVWLGYEAVQLMPVHPTVVFEGGPAFFEAADEQGETLAESVNFVLRRPTTTNWGYDVVISGCGAINPALLESRRPDELVDLLEILHAFPKGGIKVVLDVVFGHADNQAIGLLTPEFFAGPNMYGQDLAYRHPVVRAILLEMYRRLVDFGFDGVRVDGAQDFKIWDPEAQVLRHDDAFLRAMSLSEQSVAGRRYRPWMIFEDGRPWPREDWELASTYRAVIEDQVHDPEVFQWGPLTFAHNTPFLYTFWISKWWRVLEIVHHGQNWITGCANHDTVRRGAQLSTKLNINTRLGDTYCAILDHAYDHPAANLLTHGMLSGVPMDFLNASMRASWGFMRNTDDRYGVKLMAEESSFLIWQVDDMSYNKVGRFPRLKAFGFEHVDDLRAFVKVLEAGVEATDYDLDAIADIMRVSTLRLEGPRVVDVPTLKRVARAFMDDLHDYCNVSHYVAELDPAQVHFNLSLRRFRRERPWLRGAFESQDHFDRRWPADGTVLFRGWRKGPDGEQVGFVANMEGAPVEVVPAKLLAGAGEGWSLALATPHTLCEDVNEPVVLRDSQGLLLTRR
ncbi:hypothetical protein G6O69_19540 [Pseudenhygromyxa sp. WMMC2535]|uniref:glucosylglycerol hydrolase n=1 Tax=Pseudenhygromyxa sp. WMMC2535 TaxID=2712867 RepID=UPI0015553563|nr:glucosylglycerol hydrolase [Pseudenhygromyxa sp. WMMC2535]NVB40048.1 hypothetical protein [Pseudenhygromyxa sp. WMMC2535]